MKYFNLKGFNAKAFRATVLLGLLGFLVIGGFFFIGLVARHGEAGVIVPLLVVGIGLFLTKRLFRKNYRIGVSAEQIVFLNSKTGLPLCPPIAPQEIAMIQHKINLGDNYLHFIRRGEARPFLKISTLNESATVHELLVEIGKHTAFARNTTKHGWDQYISQEASEVAPEVMQKVQKRNTDPGKRNGRIIGIACLLFVVGAFVFMAVKKSDEGYRLGVDEITYNGIPLNINREEIEWLSSSVVKDSSQVFFLGQIVEWADTPTFEAFGPTFFRDKNGLYQEKINFFSQNELVPLQGDFDAETLTGVGHTFYKDKDRVYYFDYNLGAGKNPLKPLKIEGIDAATFQEVNYLWYADRNNVYFGTWADFRVCPEIDRETFEVLTYQVAKDKNNVYYMTRYLTSDEGNSRTTERDNYTILKGAHAPSFVMIDHETFEDENTVWTIENSGS